MLLLATVAPSAEAQLAGPGKNDQFLGLFLQNAGGRFSGFFDHNLRDLKRATTLNIVWKFK